MTLDDRLFLLTWALIFGDLMLLAVQQLRSRRWTTDKRRAVRAVSKTIGNLIWLLIIAHIVITRDWLTLAIGVAAIALLVLTNWWRKRRGKVKQAIGAKTRLIMARMKRAMRQSERTIRRPSPQPA